ncbi:MAG TPA: DivIVA domain-containing protein [Mycobacteriales bacterium]|nr:DivIVA domain-containing protein [Mycobacteriales bacterium]
MALVAVVVIGVALLAGVAIVLGLVDSPMSVEPVDGPDDGLPDRALTSHDVSGLRFRLGLRGYRMDDVDRALDRLRDALYDAEQRAQAAQQPVEDAPAPKPAGPRRPRAAKPAVPPDEADGA